MHDWLHLETESPMVNTPKLMKPSTVNSTRKYLDYLKDSATTLRMQPFSKTTDDEKLDLVESTVVLGSNTFDRGNIRSSENILC